MPQRVAVAHTVPVPEGAPMQFSDYDLDFSDPLVGGAAWLNGEYVPISEASVQVVDSGFFHSDATYTVASVWHGSFFRLGDHVDRLLDGARRWELDCPLTKEEIIEVTHGVVARSGLREAYVDMFITGGIHPRLDYDLSAPRGARFMVYAAPYSWIFLPDKQMSGISVMVPKAIRRNLRNQIDPQVKNTQWGELTVGEREAHRSGYDSAILLDQNELLSEGPGFNVVLVKDRVVITPEASALPGITRRTALEIAAEKGYSVELRDVPAAELYDADEIFVTTTAGGITPVVQLDGKPVGDGTPGPVSVSIQKRYWDMMAVPGVLGDAVDYAKR